MDALEKSVRLAARLSVVAGYDVGGSCESALNIPLLVEKVM